MAQDKDVLLAILEEQGRHFMDSFAVNPLKRRASNDDFIDAGSRNVKARRDEDDGEENHDEDDASDDTEEAEAEEEWTGFALEGDGDIEDIERDNGDPNVVVFNEKGPPASKAIKPPPRAFMSSKVSRIKDSSEAKSNLEDEADGDLENERSNLQNDAILHRLIHTKLLSGSLNPELNMTSAERRKALAGRVLELSGKSKLGKGEKIVRQEEKQRAGKSVRDGLKRKQREREEQALNEAKTVGNYHPVLKKLFESSEGKAKPRNRDRGLKMGIGRFSGGTLKLSQEDIQGVGDSKGRSGRGRGRGRGRSRGGSGRGTGRGLKR